MTIFLGFRLYDDLTETGLNFSVEVFEFCSYKSCNYSFLTYFKHPFPSPVSGNLLRTRDAPRVKQDLLRLSLMSLSSGTLDDTTEI